MTTGTKCCEHHREGLPYCVECAEESVKAHDKACALLAEAQAEIENLQWRVSNEKAKAEAALALNDRLLRWSTRRGLMPTTGKANVTRCNEWCTNRGPESTIWSASLMK